jgi:hypothetical protein
MRAWIILGLASIALGASARAETADAPRLPAAGTRLALTRARAAASASVRFGDLARADAARQRLEGALAPLVILQGEETTEGEAEAGEPFAPAPLEHYSLPGPGLAPLVPSPAPAQSFMGLDDIPRVGSNTLTIPPDVDGAVGPDRILEGLNNNYRAFDKATGAILGTVSISTFWAAAGAGPVFDPKTLYDPVQQRWIAVVLSDSRSTASSILIGVSQTSDPNGSWNLFRVLGDSTGVNWVDFPNVGFNENWIAVNVNLFTIAANTSNGSRCLIVDYAQARAGVFAGSFANGTGFCSSPVATASPTEPALYVPTHLSSASGTYRLDTITGPVAAPVYTVGVTRARGVVWTQPTGSILPQAPPLSGSSLCGVPACQIETQDAQIRSTPVFRDGSIWYTQTIGLPAGGLTHTSVQWTRLEAATGNVLDGGVIDEPTATGDNGGHWYAYPHVAVNGAGDAIVCFSQYSSAQFPSAGYAMRFAADPLGTLREPVLVRPGEDYYHKDFGSGRNRWGDFAKAQVDPSDDESLWLVAQYAKARTGTDDGSTGSNSSRWGTWWARIGPTVTLGPGPSVPEGNVGTTPITIPVTLSQPLAADLVVNYAVNDGTATVADGDYDSPATSVVIPAGTLGASIPLNIHGDTKYESDEFFTVTLVSAPGATIAAPSQDTVTILNDDPPPPPTLSIADASIPEGNSGVTPLWFHLTLSLAIAQPVSVQVTTRDSSATVAGNDYVALDTLVTLPPLTVSDSVAVRVIGDITCELDETFKVALSGLVGALPGDTLATGTILNDDNCTAVADEPLRFELAAVAPNPAVTGARIGYTLPRSSHVRLAISDVQGRTLAVLVDGVQPAGRCSARWDAAGSRGAVAAGVYFVRIEAGGNVATKRFAVTR